MSILAPGIMEEHLTAGFTQSLTLRMSEWELAASYAWKFWADDGSGQRRDAQQYGQPDRAKFSSFLSR